MPAHNWRNVLDEMLDSIERMIHLSTKVRPFRKRIDLSFNQVLPGDKTMYHGVFVETSFGNRGVLLVLRT